MREFFSSESLTFSVCDLLIVVTARCPFAGVLLQMQLSQFIVKSFTQAIGFQACGTGVAFVRQHTIRLKNLFKNVLYFDRFATRTKFAQGRFWRAPSRNLAFPRQDPSPLDIMANPRHARVLSISSKGKKHENQGSDCMEGGSAADDRRGRTRRA
jgi:hypothetical protein